MQLTERQSQVLNEIVEEYINSAKPVSSKLLEKKHHFKICPATIRIEMQKLSDDGFIFQPHTSAGRVPTDKGYRFYVDNFLEKDFFEDSNLGIDELIDREASDAIKMLQIITKNLASFSSNLALGYLLNEKLMWKDGWEEVIQEPEFKETGFISHFAEAVKNLEKEMEDIKLDSSIEVFIGKENPFPKAKEFSTIITKCHFPGGEGFLAIVGPKRMTYDKNINYLKSLMNRL
jgi:transcriptional regulator of heat shock response